MRNEDDTQQGWSALSLSLVEDTAPILYLYEDKGYLCDGRSLFGLPCQQSVEQFLKVDAVLARYGFIQTTENLENSGW